MRFLECKTIQELTMSWQKAIKNSTEDISEINRDYTTRKQELLNNNKYTLSYVEHLVPLSINVSFTVGKFNQAILKNNILEIMVPFIVQEFKAADSDKENTFTFKTVPYVSFSIK